jgi:hypothetical protein
MDYYQIGAMKVFSELGQFIEEDEKNQIKITSLNSDVIQKIGSYLLEDPNKTIHKIFHEKKDDNLQILLFGEVKKLRFIDIDNVDNEIPYTNDKVKDYINIIFKNNKCNEVCTRMTINFYQSYGPINIKICGYNSKDVKIAKIDYWETCKQYDFDYLFRGFIWRNSNVKNKNIIKEYKRIKEEIIKKYF